MNKTTILKGDGTLIKTPDGYMVVGEAIKQVLIYDGELTAEEILAENEKEIKSEGFYFQENSVPMTYGVNEFGSIKVYSPALTNEEVAQEVAKSYVPLFRESSGIPNYLGEDLPTEAMVKVLAIGGDFESKEKAGMFYNSFELDKNETSNRFGVRKVVKP